MSGGKASFEPRNSDTLQDGLDVPGIHLERHSISQYTRKNLFAPINKLPVELLAHIFQLVARREARSGRKLGWIRSVTHICSHWREIAFACPSLWTIVDWSNPECAQMMIERAKSLPLSVQMFQYQINNEAEVEAMKRVLAEMHRIASLRLFASRKQLEQLLKTLQSKPAPKLKRLLLSNDSPHSHLNLPDTLFGGEDTPSLEYASFARCFFSKWALPARFGNVTYFSLHLVRERRRPTLEQWLGLLKSLPSLKSLKVAQAIPVFPASGDQDAFDMPPTELVPDAIALPHLKILDIHAADSFYNNVGGLVYILMYMIMPRLSQFNLVCGAQEIAPAFSIAPLTPHLTRLCDSVQKRDGENCQPELVRSLVIQKRCSGFLVVGGWADSKTASIFHRIDIHDAATEAKRARDKAQFFLSIGDEVSDFPGTVLKDNLDRLFDVLPVKGVESLSVDDTLGEMVKEWPLWWKEVDGQFSSLKNLYLKCNSSVAMFLNVFCNIVNVVNQVHGSALHDSATLDHSQNDTNPADKEKPIYAIPCSLDDMVFPKLKEIHIRFAPYAFRRDSPAFTAFVDALMARSELGIPVEKLTLENCGRLSRRDVEMLREVVAIVEWDEYRRVLLDDETDDFDPSEDSDDTFDSEDSDGEIWGEEEWAAYVAYGEDSGNSDSEWPGIRGSRS